MYIGAAVVIILGLLLLQAAILYLPRAANWFGRQIGKRTSADWADFSSC